jgi:hypothetical protein
MPKARVGMRALPSLALIAASGAITPLMLPLPNESGSFEACTVRL